jgi:hypothetical protein
VAIAKSMGFAVIATTDASGALVETVADVTPFMIWFGILLAVNMQTSFMHPPFGFALFYLRSVAPKEPYEDKVTGRTMQPVATSDIYWGAVPYLGIQIVMIAVVLALPWLAMNAMIKPPPAPAAIEQPLEGGATPSPTSSDTPAATGGRFALPPGPLRIEGAPDPAYTGAGAPTLDMRDGPRFD